MCSLELVKETLVPFTLKRLIPISSYMVPLDTPMLTFESRTISPLFILHENRKYVAKLPLLSHVVVVKSFGLHFFTAQPNLNQFS